MNAAAIPDTQPLGPTDLAQIQVTVTCIPFGGMSNQDIQAAFANQLPIQSVVSVTEDLSSLVNVGTTWDVVVNMIQGSTAADLRAAALNAMNAVNSAKTVPCGNITTGQISLLSNSAAPSVNTTISLVAIAILAVVALVFLRTR